jgi:hypothetical protein
MVGLGVVPGSIYGLSVLAQAVETNHVDWINMGFGGAIVAAFGFLLTKLLPQMTKESNETVRYIQDKQTERDKYLADRQVERETHLSQVFQAENQSQREQFNIWMDKVLELATREACHKPKDESNV